MRWRHFCSLFVIGALVFSASISLSALAQDASPADPIVEALGGAPTPATDPAPSPTISWQGHDSGAADLWVENGIKVIGGDGGTNSWVNLANPFGSSSNTVELTATIDGGQVQVTLNGQPVPADQIVNRGGEVTVHDGNGRSVATITVTNDGRVTIPQGFSFRGPAAWTMESTQRKVIGVRTGSLEPSLSRHLQLAEGEGILVTSVIDGQPAARAGMQAHDVIVAINGQRPASLSALRGALDQVDENGTVRLTIVRAGRTFDLDCGVASVSTPVANSTALSRGSYTLSTTGDAPTSLYWHRQRKGDRATTSSQGITTFAPGITPLPGGRYGARENVVTDPQGRPFPIRGQSGTGGAFTISGGQNSGAGGRGGSSGGSGGQDTSGRTVVGIGSNSTSGAFGGVGTSGPAVVYPDRFAPAAENSKILEERTKAIEERLERLEKLLEQLVEQKSRDPRAAADLDRKALAHSDDRDRAPTDSLFALLSAPF